MLNISLRIKCKVKMAIFAKEKPVVVINETDAVKVKVSRKSTKHNRPDKTGQRPVMDID